MERDTQMYPQGMEEDTQMYLQEMEGDTQMYPQEIPPIIRGLEKKHILIVESNARIADLLASILSDERHARCAIATTYRDALQITNILKFDLILLNTHLIDGNGITLYDRLHRRIHLARVPFLVLCACQPYYQSEIESRRLTCLALPFGIDEMLDAVDQCLPRSSRSFQ
jgi:DNA-binding response OmpR family regulator